MAICWSRWCDVCVSRRVMTQAFERRTSKKAVNASHHASSVCRNRSNRRLLSSAYRLMNSSRRSGFG
jgi:hypothetical protein